MSETKLSWENISEQASDLGIGSSNEYLKLEQGENVIRVLSEPVHFVTYFMGKGKASVYERNATDEIKRDGDPSHRFLCQVYDTKDKSLKIAEFGWSIVKAIGTLSKSSQYNYKGLPPFDLIIQKDGVDLKTKYTVIPGPNKDPMTPEIIEGLSKKPLMEEYLEKEIQRQAGTDDNPNATKEDKNPFNEPKKN